MTATILPLAGVPFPPNARVWVRERAQHGTVRSSAGHFHVVDLDDGGTAIALTGAIEAARPHAGWKPVDVNQGRTNAT